MSTNNSSSPYKRNIKNKVLNDAATQIKSIGTSAVKGTGKLISSAAKGTKEFALYTATAATNKAREFDKFRLENYEKGKKSYIADTSNSILLPSNVIKNSELKETSKFINNMIARFKGKKITSKADIQKFKDLKKNIDLLKENPEINNEDDKKILEKLESVYEETKNDILKHFDENKDLIDNTDKIIIDFKDTADLFKTLLKYLLLLCVFIYIIVLILSFINVVNLIYLCIKSVISLFYNTSIINNDIISFKIKGITKTSKSDFSKDICNVLNEQLTSLSVFNMTIYIFYILLAYVFIYILYYVYYTLIMKYTHKLVGTIKDIDPDADLMKLILLIFGLSLVHILIYKILLKGVAINQYKKIDAFENNIDKIIKDYIDLSSPAKYTSEDKKFYDLLNDSTKIEEINSFFQNKLNSLNSDGSDIGKYILIFNLYNYYSSYLLMNDVNHYKIGTYLQLISKTDNDKEEITFLSLLDTNNKRLIKLYHEDLSFYKNIPKDKIELFKPINNEVVNIISSINKLIITYSGTFAPFIMMSAYIIIIFIYNIFSVYLLFEGIHETRYKNLFPDFVYTISDYYKKFINRLLDRE